jgi:Na+-transporting NADH:ubiquinone oxidoreductase subunit NqrB
MLNMQYINNYIDNFLNKITMYRVVLYGLTFLLSLSILIGFTSYGGYNGINIIFSFLILCLSCGISNYLIAKLLDVQVNVESQWITAFILTLIVSPVASINDMFICALIGVGAMLSKYLLTIHKKHLFNPVAAVLVVVGLLGGGRCEAWLERSDC